jgi:hypothetical protein
LQSCPQLFLCHRRRDWEPVPPVSPVTREPAGGTDAHARLRATSMTLQGVGARLFGNRAVVPSRSGLARRFQVAMR